MYSFTVNVNKPIIQVNLKNKTYLKILSWQWCNNRLKIGGRKKMWKLKYVKGQKTPLSPKQLLKSPKN